MPYTLPKSCPACHGSLRVTELACPHCATRIQGDFYASPLWNLREEQLHFVETFLRCRGNIREVEKSLNISYPTVRSRLDQILKDLGWTSEQTFPATETISVLERLEAGEVTVEEALEELRGETTEHGSTRLRTHENSRDARKW
ncbi:DUF2089 domain-containing protein [Alicyclobacillus tolerans]|uniref:DUF2089 domain-containing protein n=1 Tax=Alicyclobacillus tolerans TaxID=90970 RepID=A0A1M6K3P8_9BACL|nr:MULTISPECIES: DUF2089 domain-containing protein [Alicyclobacillus]QRF23065.1 DUF2089 domain-containing protein [Alicyclobacillus sp. TC]SHJ53567.1 hypothetical protein SAMN05443507_101139 [Alicyclobacillus montanus]